MIFGKNTTSYISKLSYVISRAIRGVTFETNLKYHEWCLCQISRTNHASIICLYTTRKRVVIFTCRYFKLSWNTTANQIAKISHVVQYNKNNGTCNSITACGISYKKQFLISTSIRIPEETCHRNCLCTFCRSHLRQMDKQRITRSIFIDLKKALRFISLTTIVYCIK